MRENVLPNSEVIVPFSPMNERIECFATTREAMPVVCRKEFIRSGTVRCIQKGSDKMTPNEFVQSLANIAPSVKELQREGLSEVMAMKIHASYLCHKREKPLGIITSNDLMALMNDWDVSKVEVGMVRLIDSPITLARGIQVGLVEADPLVVLNHTEELLVEELGGNEHVLWYVAQNSRRFLDALMIAAKFLNDRALGLVDFDDITTAKSKAYDCSKRAGGEKYSSFYSMLLGVE